MTKTKGAALTRRLLGTIVALGVTGAALAQGGAQSGAQGGARNGGQDPAQDTPARDATGLNLPTDFQIFGKLDPNVRKATAIVNEAIITGTDVDQRVNFIAAANGAKLNAEERERLQLQVLRQLIDETLQIQQAKVNDITVTKGEIDQAFAGVARNLQKTPAVLTTWLREEGSSDRSLRRQIEGELAWNRYLRKRVEPFVNVGDEEVKAILDRLEAAKGTEEYHLNEIYLAATPDRQQQVFDSTKQLIAEIGKGQAPFAYFARNFSEASTRGVGGDLGWVRSAQLPAPLAEAAQTMQVGQVAGPVATPGGFSILYLVDKRQVLMADPRDARLSLKQLTIKFPAGTTQTQATARTSAFAEAIQKLQGCGSVDKMAASLNAEVVDNDAIRIRDLPPPLQAIMLKLQVGQATPPFGSPSEGVRTLVMCGRDEAPGGQLPGAQQIQNQLEQQRVNLRAQQALRDLRRDAVIDYR
ncbi:peptidylprolyl isomerase [Sphingomonas sp. Leaf231]|uniref:peptidylprolyl isomerase n=1 Tax=Sphingomonas sp. Leaf231 TaxID=1736301 RepID=UPI0006FF0E7C|nr:peptidylprolyl isomerase [Sphingomonas sp. Leaf231]KQN94422.1 peptidylprolyl isomerase [Sphingomonas sp. Leaf231]